MKKIILSVAAVVALSLNVACSSDDNSGSGSSCDSLLENGMAALEAYQENPSLENCVKAKAAASAIIAANCEDGIDEAQGFLAQDCANTGGEE